MGSPYAIRRHQGWYFRLRVPPDLAPLLGSHVVRTLRTTCPREARARAALLAGSAPDLWRMLRIRAMAEMLGKPIDEFTLADLARENTPRVAADLALLDEAAQRRLRDHIYELFAAADTTRRAEEADNDYVRLQVDMFKRGKERGLLEAIAAAAHAAPALPAVAPTPAASPAEPLVEDPRARATLLDLAPAFFAHTGMGESGRESNMQAFREFHGMTEGKDLAAITAADVGDYKAWLIKRPGRAGRLEASRKTVIKKLNHVRALLAWAAEDEGILAASPGEKVRPPKVSRTAEEQVKRLPFDPEALATIFASPLYTGAFSPSRLGRPGHYRERGDKRFFLLAMLLTGARTEELPGAGLFDLDGIPCLDLRKTGTKTVAGARVVPILPDLRRAGFLAWARTRLDSGGTLFEGREAVEDWVKWTGRYLEPLGVTDELHTPYSLRHSFKQMLRAGNVNMETANRIFGHEGGTTGEGYARGPLTPEEARLFLRAVRPPLDLSGLHVAR